jgi:glucose-6-phosphate dehydrogenase assembly protein OpcA
MISSRAMGADGESRDGQSRRVHKVRNAMSNDAAGTGPGGTLARIEKELREIWATNETGAQPKTRVCTMNLVVVAGSPELADGYLHIVDEVTRTSLARAIVVALDPDSKKSELLGDVSAVCSLEQGENVCTERIRLTATGHVCARVASTVEVLLVPEIPTVLVWLGKVYVDDPVFESLAKMADRVVTDSEYASLSSLLHLARWSRESPGRPHVADLAWTRLGPWQDLVARFFDEPRLAELATKVTHLSLRQASIKGTRLGSEGALILGWMATRLGWKSSRLGGALRFRRPDGENVTVEFGVTPRPEGVAPSAISAITIEAEHDGVKLRGTLSRELASGLEGATPDADVVLWKLEADDAPVSEQRVRFGANKGAKWLERTLHRPANDPTLMESAQFAEDVVEDGIVCN